jgi:predicted ferric reductase
MLVDPLVRRTTAPFFYLLVLFLVGAASYFYSVLMARAVRKAYPYAVESIRKLNGTTAELTLKSRREKLPFTAGQFAFVRF